MLIITSATWGYKNHKIGVTSAIQALVNSDNLQPILVSFNNDILGEVEGCKGFVKELEITYQYLNKKRHIIVQEHCGGNTRYFTINSETPSVTNTKPAHDSGLIIL